MVTRSADNRPNERLPNRLSAGRGGSDGFGKRAVPLPPVGPNRCDRGAQVRPRRTTTPYSGGAQPMRTLTWILCSMAALAAFAQDQTLVFTNAKIIPIVGEEIDNGMMMIQNGKIIGCAQRLPMPKNARVINLKGKVIMPGLVDTHSHIGGSAGADRSAPIQPDVRVFESLNMRSSGFQKAQAGGLTTINVMPGSGHLMSGQTIYLKLREGDTIDDLAIRAEDGSYAGGMKMANGTNSRRDPPFPTTRAKSAAMVRAEFVKAQEYQKKLAAAEDDPDKQPPRDLRMEALIELMEGKRVVHHHTHRHDDILTVLRLAEEFGFEVVLHHVSEGWAVAEEIAASGAASSIIVIDSPGGKLEAKDFRIETGAALEQAGALVGFHTDDPITDSRLFLRSAALAVRYGMSRDAALVGLTLAGAKMLRLDDRIGSLEEGKDADFIVLSGDPLSVYTKVEQTWVEGQQVFDLTNDQDRLYAEGGYGASDDVDPEFVHGFLALEVEQ